VTVSKSPSSLGLDWLICKSRDLDGVRELRALFYLLETDKLPEKLWGSFWRGQQEDSKRMEAIFEINYYTCRNSIGISCERW